jgi:hypothetical protein
MSEGGTPPVWMGLTTNPTPIYWNDGSYFETTEKGNGLKVSYDNYPYNGSDLDNHSAITTTIEGVFISKWGAYPLVKHAKDYTPYSYSSLHYFKKNTATISGPTQICDQATYTIDNFPQGATVNWTTSNDLTVASGQNTATVNIARTYDLAINNFIRATITINGYSFVIEKTGIQIGTVNPLIKIYDARGRYELAPPYYTNTAYTIVAYGNTFSTNPFNYQWVINQPVESGEPPLLYNDKQFSFIADSVGSFNFTLRYNGECGWSLPTSKAVYFYQNYMLLSFYPNPATDLLTVSVGYEEESISESDISTKKTIYNESYCVELWHEKYGKVKSVESNESIVQIQLQDLPRGLYAIHLKVKNKTIRKKLLQLM